MLYLLLSVLFLCLLIVFLETIAVLEHYFHE
jgi:hypothetical protein